MSLWISLFQRPKRRHYALLDEEHRCRMLLTAIEPPRSELLDRGSGDTARLDRQVDPGISHS